MRGTVLLLSGLSLALTPIPVAFAQPEPVQRHMVGDPYAAWIAEASQRFGIPATWIRAVLRAESAGDPRAVSSAGAIGLMQVMPATWADLRIRHRLGRDPYDPRDNILAGAAYLRELHDRYGNVAAMLAAYNAGPGRYEASRRGRPLPVEKRSPMSPRSRRCSTAGHRPDRSSSPPPTRLPGPARRCSQRSRGARRLPIACGPGVRRATLRRPSLSATCPPSHRSRTACSSRGRIEGTRGDHRLPHPAPFPAGREARMNIAYADPPYIGCAHLYRDHPDYAGEVDHARLVERLDAEFDGWILHAAATPRSIATLAPLVERTGAHWMVWVKGFAAFKRNVPVAWAWEPVIVKAARKPVVSRRIVMRDWVQESMTLRRGLTGAKPEAVCHWAFEMVAARPDDTLSDLFPGSGAVTEAWRTWRLKFRLPDDGATAAGGA